MASALPRPIWFVASFALAASAWSLAAELWSRDELAFAVSLLALGLSLGPCFAGYLAAPRRFKLLLRRSVLFTGGLSVLAVALQGGVEIDLEGFVILLLLGTIGLRSATPG